MLTPRQQELLTILKDKPQTLTGELCQKMGISRARLNILLAPLLAKKIAKVSGQGRATVYGLGEKRDLEQIRRENWELRQKVKQLEIELEDRKVIERAKEILIGQFGILPTDAYRKMQDQSMTRSCSMRKIADGILQAYEL